MNLIISTINSEPIQDPYRKKNIEYQASKLGIKSIIYVSKAEQLQEFANCNVDYILISNFPPNSSYAIKSKGTSNNGSWIADSYQRSSDLFRELSQSKNLKRIHFISGAPQSMISLEMLKEITNDKAVDLKPKRELMDHNISYHDLLERHILYLLKITQK